MSQLSVFLSAIMAKLPRIDGASRVAVAIETGSVSISGTPTVVASSVQTLGTLTRPADAIPLHMSNIAALHIYNNIIVT